VGEGEKTWKEVDQKIKIEARRRLSRVAKIASKKKTKAEGTTMPIGHSIGTGGGPRKLAESKIVPRQRGGVGDLAMADGRVADEILQGKKRVVVVSGGE